MDLRIVTTTIIGALLQVIMVFIIKLIYVDFDYMFFMICATISQIIIILWQIWQIKDL